MASSLSHQEAVAQKAEKRVQGIDVLRGLCIIAVVLHHINLRIHFRDSSFGQWIGPAANRVLFWNGYYGVIVFFVISGFLITTWSLKRWGSLSQINRRQFYLMRFARIIPCLLGLLLVLSILDRAGVPRFTINTQHTSLGRAVIAALTFHVNWLEARTGYLPASWDVLWSLSVEEVFYVFFPLLCTLLRKQALLIGVLSCFLIVGPFARVQTHNELWADYGYLSCMDGIALGCLAAIVAAKVRLGGRANMALRISGASLCLLITVFRGTAARLALYKAGLDVTTLEIGTALLLIALQQTFEANVSAANGSEGTGSEGTGSEGNGSEGNVSRDRSQRQLSATRSKVAAAGKAAAGRADAGRAAASMATAGKAFRSAAFLCWFGRNSYEVYLTHMFVIWPMVMLFFHFHQSLNTAPLWFLATTALAGVLGYVVARFYSEPLNYRLRARFRPAAKMVAEARD